MALLDAGKGEADPSPQSFRPEKDTGNPPSTFLLSQCWQKNTTPSRFIELLGFTYVLPPLKNCYHSMPALVGIGTRRLQINIASWNVQGLRTLGKYDQILAFMIKYKMDILFMQETWQTTSSHFPKNTPTSFF